MSLTRLSFFSFFGIIVLFGGCKSKETLFRNVPASESHVNFVNEPEKHRLFNILYYLYYYNGGGVSTGDINNDGLPDIYFTANRKGGNKLYLNKGNFVFEDITDKAGVAGISDWCTGSTMTDINGDGKLDIYVSTVSGKYDLKGHNELYINQGNNTFKEASEQYGLNTSCFTTQSAFFDFDHDGDLDCYILNQSHHPHANIVDTSNRRRFDPQSGDRLYRNDIKQTGKFTDVSATAGIFQSNLGYGLGIAVADMNNDGWEDIYIGNDFHENDYYYINNKNGTFTESGAQHFRHYSRFSMGNDVADYNNDGRPDLVTVDMLPPDEKTLKTYGSDENADIYKVKLEIQGYQNQYSRNVLQKNNGNGTSFSDVGLMSGVSATDWSWSPLFADFDNDGKKDLFITSGIVKRPVDLDYIRYASDLKMKGMDRTDAYDDEAINAMPDGSSHPFFYHGDGKTFFTDQSKQWGVDGLKGYFNGSSYADLDNDGRMDMVVNTLKGPSLILQNNSPRKRDVTITFEGDSANKPGIGVKAYLFTKNGLQYQQLMLTRGFASSSEPRLHFGLDDLASIDSVLIIWPSGKFQSATGLATNKTYLFKESYARGNFDYTHFLQQPQPFTDITDSVGLTWKHQENEFLDYNLQYLIPHEESTRGPKMAVADVNNDGLDDFYVCGAKGQPGAMMIQQPGGKFISTDTAIFAINAISEDVDAKFFDANKDGFPDLWVVSGGNQVPQNVLSLEDRLYINDGKGHFTKNEKAIPQQYENKTCIATADIDNDGDTDVFIGDLGAAVSYGSLKPSFLYINDGKGNFSLNHTLLPLDSMGMVTSAYFTDLNNDNRPDLVVAGEWMQIRIFMNEGGKFREQSIPGSTGLWQTIMPADVNNDGKMDLLAGNWGHNCKIWAGKNGPAKLYVKDFDGNGSVEQILCYTKDGEEYTFLAKDELERSLPVLKKAYLKYSEVAGKTVQYMFYDLFKDYKTYTAEVLGSSVFINEGNGNYMRHDLPDELQYAPVMAFAALDPAHGSYMGVGNFYGVIPYEGRYDALQPTVFHTSKDNSMQYTAMIPGFNGEARDAKWLRSSNGSRIMAIAVNNNMIRFYRENK